MPGIFRIGLKAATSCFFILAAAGQATAQSYPNEVIKLVVPYPAGGVTDVAGRLFAKALNEQIGQTVVIENRGGAGARLGTEFVARSKPDGYTLLFGNAVTHGSAVASKSLSYNPLRDFMPIAPLFWYSSVLVCNPNLPVRNVADLIAYARKSPKPLTYSSAGAGSGNHFMGEMFSQMANITWTHVPYRGSAPALQDVIAGIVDCTFDGQARQAVESGQVRALATTGSERDPIYPDLPTLDEAGLKGYDLTMWQGLFVPAKTPNDVVEKLAKASHAAMAALSKEKRMTDVGLSPLQGDAVTFRKLIEGDLAKYKRIAAEGNIQVD